VHLPTLVPWPHLTLTLTLRTHNTPHHIQPGNEVIQLYKPAWIPGPHPKMIVCFSSQCGCHQRQWPIREAIKPQQNCC